MQAPGGPEEDSRDNFSHGGWAMPQSDCFVPAPRGRGLVESEVAALPMRTGSAYPHVPYEPLSPQSLADVDAIAFLRSAIHTRGAPG